MRRALLVAALVSLGFNTASVTYALPVLVLRWW